MKLRDLVNCNTNNFVVVSLIANDKKIYTGSHFFNINASNDYGIEDKLLECEVISYEVSGEYWEQKKVKPSIDYLKCTAFRLQVKIELPKENEDYIKPLKNEVDDDSFYLFLRNHKDLDENKVLIHYVDIEGRTVEIKLSDLQWNWAKVDLLLHFKIKQRVNNENGDLVLYLEQFRER